MQEIINKLAFLFRQRQEIDELIAKTVGFSLAVEEEAKKTPEKPGKKKKGRKPGKVKTYKQRGSKPKIDADFEEEPEGKRYRCEECDNIFHSTADYLDVSCPECGSRKAISLPL